MLGDMATETMLYHSDHRRNYEGTIGSFTEDHSYGYTPHYGISYTYKIKHWLAVGVLLDCQNTWWRRYEYEGSNTPKSKSRENFYNLSILPTVRFTYLERKRWNLYSAVMTGMVVNGGSEEDYKGRNTLVGFDIGLTFIGAGYHWGQWGVACELGQLTALRNTNAIFMVGSRLLSVGVSYDF